MTLFSSLLTVSVCIFIFVTAGFIVSRILKRNDIADSMWGVGILLVALISFSPLVGASTTPLSALVTLIAIIWASRLSLRIFFRNIKKKEDRRYVEMRARWGQWSFVFSYLQVFLLQGFLMVIVGYPFIHMALFGTESPLTIATLLGAGIWAIGFIFEAVGDYQLDTFLKNKNRKGTVMKYGLWKYTRHPNYFGEVTQWWGIWIILLSVPYGFFTIISPLLVTFLILKVSGIPMLEKAFENNPEFQEYKKSTSPFFPLPKKRI
ncbi:steroid 5-alpha reductase [Candidatus Kaiserbacteria bacterium CG10_big_fil_rev_8_21_14_0_10_45_20]|uniref:Steroid 5-alpha reductase n=1 Tax=Candidatus Kaiserbacteria bacterium CG10_big_fil_rev_8_21_14_0_10_45_20 TaxID=1974607 RepID=A0A2H0UG74_9BACT|nr:MAG: steroid 5-alpha reductase [Candidatus Kaiserbacteria bacterium CG10_big_fil_rev_8_21_14_0_10_45_20]